VIQTKTSYTDPAAFDKMAGPLLAAIRPSVGPRTLSLRVYPMHNHVTLRPLLKCSGFLLIISS
jgi:hypothetical protein